MKVFPLSEGSFTVDGTKQFVPFNTQSDHIQDRPLGSLLVEVQPFAVVTSKDVLVLDTGLGFTEPDGTPQLHANLLRNGIQPADVTKVLLTHLHRDHAGGIALKDTSSAQPSLSFPQATYIVNKQEFEIALSGLSKSYRTEDVRVLENSKQLMLVESSGTIDGYIHYAWTGAHSPWHQVFSIVEDDQTIFFGGDVAPQLMQMKTRISAKYDFDGRMAADLRKKWWQRGEQEKWTFLFYHDIRTPIFSF